MEVFYTVCNRTPSSPFHLLMMQNTLQKLQHIACGVHTFSAANDGIVCTALTLLPLAKADDKQDLDWK